MISPIKVQRPSQSRFPRCPTGIVCCRRRVCPKSAVVVLVGRIINRLPRSFLKVPVAHKSVSNSFGGGQRIGIGGRSKLRGKSRVVIQLYILNRSSIRIHSKVVYLPVKVVAGGSSNEKTIVLCGGSS